MSGEANVLAVESYAIGIANDDSGQACCLIFSIDSLANAGEIALGSTLCQVVDGNLHFTGASVTLLLKKPAGAVLECVQKGLPVVVLDNARGLEHLVPTASGEHS